MTIRMSLLGRGEDRGGRFGHWLGGGRILVDDMLVSSHFLSFILLFLLSSKGLGGSLLPGTSTVSLSFNTPKLHFGRLGVCWLCTGSDASPASFFPKKPLK